MRKELSTGLAMFAMNVPSWAKATPEEREKAWHVGAILGESIRNLALQWRAEALQRTADNVSEQKAAPTELESGGQAASEEPQCVDSTRGNDGGRSAQPAEAPTKRGPKRDYEASFRVAEIVARLAPDGDWRSKLDDVCEALHDEGIPFPKTWRSKDRNCRSGQ